MILLFPNKLFGFRNSIQDQVSNPTLFSWIILLFPFPCRNSFRWIWTASKQFILIMQTIWFDTIKFDIIISGSLFIYALITYIECFNVIIFQRIVIFLLFILLIIYLQAYFTIIIYFFVNWLVFKNGMLMVVIIQYDFHQVLKFLNIYSSIWIGTYLVN